MNLLHVGRVLWTGLKDLVPRVGQPGGAAYGVLVHAVLALASFDADGSRLQELATTEARMLGLSEGDAAQAAAAAGRALSMALAAASQVGA